MLRKVLDNLEEIITIPLIVLLLIVLSWQIVTRWLLNSPSLWSEELARLLFMYIALIGCAMGIKRDAHVNISFLQDKLPDKLRLALLLFLDGAVLVTLFVIIYLGYQHVTRTAFLELITLGISSKWMNYSLPLGGGLMAIRQLQKIIGLLGMWRHSCR